MNWPITIKPDLFHLQRMEIAHSESTTVPPAFSARLDRGDAAVIVDNQDAQVELSRL